MYNYPFSFFSIYALQKKLAYFPVFFFFIFFSSLNLGFVDFHVNITITFRAYWFFLSATHLIHSWCNHNNTIQYIVKGLIFFLHRLQLKYSVEKGIDDDQETGLIAQIEINWNLIEFAFIRHDKKKSRRTTKQTGEQ